MSEKITNPAFRRLIAEQMKMNSFMKAFIETQKPKDFIADVFPLDKAVAFVDTRVECIGADLIQITTRGDLTHISYKIVQLNGMTTWEIEAAELPVICGPISALLVTNDTAEAGMWVNVTRNQGSMFALAALKHGTPMSGVAAMGDRMFYAEQVEYALGADNFFELDDAMGDLPTLNFVGIPLVNHIKIHTIKYQFMPTAAATYQLYLLEGASDDDQQSEAEIIYDSGAGMVGGDIHIAVAGGAPATLPVMARLTDPGVIYYILDWNVAPGNTYGYIRVYGETLA